MLSKQQEEANRQLVCIGIEDLVPKEHLVRKIAAVMDFGFIYEIVKDWVGEGPRSPPDVRLRW